MATAPASPMGSTSRGGEKPETGSPVSHNSESGAGWSVIGRAGADIASVEIEPAGAPAILATLENGWFAGWWPANVPLDRLGDPALAPDVVIRGYHTAGALLAEVRP